MSNVQETKIRNDDLNEFHNVCCYYLIKAFERLLARDCQTSLQLVNFAINTFQETRSNVVLLFLSKIEARGVPNISVKHNYE